MAKYPNITVDLLGQDGNAFFIMARMIDAMQRGGVPDEEIRAFTNDAISGNYDHLLATCADTVVCTNANQDFE